MTGGLYLIFSLIEKYDNAYKVSAFKQFLWNCRDFVSDKTKNQTQVWFNKFSVILFHIHMWKRYPCHDGKPEEPNAATEEYNPKQYFGCFNN